MIATILIVGLAYLWLLIETDWLTCNLMGLKVPELLDLDIETEFDGSDLEYSTDYQAQSDDDIAYHNWLTELYKPQYHYGSQPENQVNPQDRWMVQRDDLQKRRAGEMLYQRGNKYARS